MPGKHAILSPSGFKALMLCPAKPAMEMGMPDQSSQYADEGTRAHEIAAAWLEGEETVVCSPDMAEYIQVYVDTVRDYQGDGELFIEQALPIGHITGEYGAEGTGDAIILRGDEITVIDLKYGRGVEVDAEQNPQLMLYALGALEKFGMVGDFTRVRMVISQPRVSRAPSEWSCTVAELEEWGLKYASPAAKKALSFWEDARDGSNVSDQCRPAEDACRFCKAKAVCPALEATVKAALGAEFTDLTTADKLEQEQIVENLVSPLSPDQLGAKMDAIGLIEDWCKAIRGCVEKQLLAGVPVAGYKLVQGKQGNRTWADADDAEKLMKSMRLKKDEMYDLKLISPTTAEKILKDTPKRWSRIAPLITRSEGKPSVAPVSDKRAAIEVKPVESEFEAIIDAQPSAAVVAAMGAEDLV
jgi:hypothetical protein